MKLLLTAAAAATFAALSMSVAAEDAAAPAAAPPAETGPLATANFTSTIYLTTNYIFRGISNSDGPAIQGSLDWAYDGFYVGAWASNTEFSDSHFEIDYYGGYRWTWNDIALNVGGIYYTYPGENGKLSSGFDPGSTNPASPNLLDPDAWYGEFTTGASYTFAKTQFAPSFGLTYNYSPDAFGSDGDSHAIQGSFGLSLPYDVAFYANVGWQTTAGDKSSGIPAAIPFKGGLLDGYDYVYYGVGVNKTLKGFKLDLGYYGTDQSPSLKAFYPDGPINGNTDKVFHNLIEGRVVFTISRTF